MWNERSVRRSFLSSAVLVLACVSPAGARVVYVSVNSHGGDGTSWSRAMTNLESALSTAGAGDQVWVAAGGYYASYAGSGFELKTNMKVYGGFAGDETTFDQRDPASNGSAPTAER